MEYIVSNEAYKNMPNPHSKDGRILWQVSSGKSTSFYKDYVARFQWWVDKSDKLMLEGSRNSNDRFSKAARIIHPTKMRPCRLCGKKLNVGYFYSNKILAKRLNKLARSEAFSEHMPIPDLIGRVLECNLELNALLVAFPERFEGIDIKNAREATEIFERTIHIRSNLLSPGFMCNPPDRLDGFHDYGLCCRKRKDPGRHDENMRKYNHDRRVFQWWVGGNWKAADTLYNLAGSGICEFCKKAVERVSPDHVGPLACGFKHDPYFRALCGPCNSSRNRRMSVTDIQLIHSYEESNNTSLASVQTRCLWSEASNIVKTDEAAEKLASYLRSLQDLYIRALFQIKKVGGAYFLTNLISHSLAHKKYQFEGLNPATFNYDKCVEQHLVSEGSKSLECRVIRIAFDELDNYVESPMDRRKLKKIPTELRPEKVFSSDQLIYFIEADPVTTELAESWQLLLRQSDLEAREKLIGKAIVDPKYHSRPSGEVGFLSLLQSYCSSINRAACQRLREELEI